MTFLSYRYQIGMGGFNYNNNKTDMQPGCMISGSKNFNILENSIETRGGTDVVLTLPERDPISSLFPLKNEDGSLSMLSTTYAGSVYKDQTLIHSQPTKIERATYTEWNENIIICTGVDIPLVYDKKTGIIFNYPDEYLAADWKLTKTYPSIMLIHGYGETVRAWATGTLEWGNSVYYSDHLDVADVSPVPNFAELDKAGKFVLNTKPNERINGSIVYGDKLFAFTDTEPFILDASASDTADWNFQKGLWRGGTASQNTLVNTENDVISFQSDGTAYSLTAVMAYGDYKQASLTYQHSIDKYINENVDLNDIEYSHILFDPKLRAIKIFVTHTHSTLNDTALVYFIDKTPGTGWAVHKNDRVQSGYDACSSAVYVGDGGSRTFTGDYFGRIWELERPYIVDDGEFFTLRVDTPWVSAEDQRQTKRFATGWLEIQNFSPMRIKIGMESTASSEERESSQEIIVKGEAVFDEALWDDAIFASPDHKAQVKYLIHKIGTSLKQTFEFVPVDADAAKWDEAIFDDENHVFGYGYKHYKRFSILANILDFSVVSGRITI